MGIFDKAKDALSGHGDQTSAGIDKVGDVLDEKTGGKYAERVDQGQELANKKLAEQHPGEVPPAG